MAQTQTMCDLQWRLSELLKDPYQKYPHTLAEKFHWQPLTLAIMQHNMWSTIGMLGWWKSGARIFEL